MKGIAICWPQKARRTATVAARGRIPLHCVPHQATLPGSQLALVAPNGKVQLLCLVARIDGPRRVHLASGEYKQNGYELIAKRGTIRTSLSAALCKLPFRWRAIGQMRYFDQRLFRPLTISEGRPGGPVLSDSGPEGHHGSLRFSRLRKNSDSSVRAAWPTNGSETGTGTTSDAERDKRCKRRA